MMLKDVWKNDLFKQRVHIFALCNLALAQPLLDVLAKNPTFFVANRVHPEDIIFVLAFLCICIPLLFVALTGLLGTLHKPLGRIVHALQVSFLVMVPALLAAKKLDLHVPGILMILGSAVVGIAFGFTYARYKPMQSFVTALSPAIVIVPVLFLFISPVSKLVFPSRVTLVGRSIKPETPITMVVFDEFPLMSIMDSSENIDATNYPNFGALAGNSYWFRNATTVSDGTEWAVPAILTGKRPDSSAAQIPTLADYPNNIFTLLGSSYKVQAIESATALCPPDLNGTLQLQVGALDRLSILLSNVELISLHIFLPKDLTASLPSISKNWGGFGNAAAPADSASRGNGTSPPLKDSGDEVFKNRRELVRHFIDAIKKGPVPTFYFMHVLLPHYPWEYLPSGKKYPYNLYKDPLGTSRIGLWGNDECLINQSYSFHKMQVGFVDKVLGEVVQRLKSEGMYDESLIIVCADHGFSFKPQDCSRFLTDTNFDEILPIPLILKLPHQKQPVVSDRNVETIDIVPSIADLLGIQLPWAVDGESLFDTTKPERTEKIILGGVDIKTVHHYGPALGEKNRYVAHALPGNIIVRNDVWQKSAVYSLLGKSLDDVKISSEKSFAARIINKFAFQSIDTSVEFQPVVVRGRLDKDYSNMSDYLAIALNGKIQSLTRPQDSQSRDFAALLPESALRPGYNQLEVFLVKENGGDFALLRSNGNTMYSLRQSDDLKSEFILSPDGKQLVIRYNYGNGEINSAEVSGNAMMIRGWAADVSNVRFPTTVIAFLNDKLRFEGSVGSMNRPDIAKQYGVDTLTESGFVFNIVASPAEILDVPTLRVFAVYDDTVAAEIIAWVNVSKRLRDRYTLHAAHGNQPESLQPVAGKYVLPVNSSLLNAYLDGCVIDHDTLQLKGWAAEISIDSAASAIAVFVNGRNVETFSTGVDRPDLVIAYGKHQLEEAGFFYRLPLSLIGTRTDSVDVRLLAISGDGRIAGEVNYPANFPFRHHQQKIRVADRLDESRIVSSTLVPAPADSVLRTFIESRTRDTIVISPGALTGYLDSCTFTNGDLFLKGWAADLQKFTAADYIAVFLDKKNVASISTGIQRLDLVAGYHHASLLTAGFYRNKTRIGMINGATHIRLYAVSSRRKVASELKYLSTCSPLPN